MFVGHVNDMPKIDMTPGGAKGAAKQVAVGPEQGWEDYVMRIKMCIRDRQKHYGM